MAMVDQPTKPPIDPPDCRKTDFPTFRQGWIADSRSTLHHWGMQVYQPIDVGVSIVAVSSDLVAFQWQVNGIVADFLIPSDDTHVLRIAFDQQCIVRILDEMPLSTEADSVNSKGLVPNHFAYKVQGSTFEAAQSSSWREVNGPMTHYQFITGWACMDVLSAAEPSFSVVPRTQ